MDYVNQLAPGPLGGSDADQKLAAAWVDKLEQWDGNLFIAANSDPGGLIDRLFVAAASLSLPSLQQRPRLNMYSTQLDRSVGHIHQQP